MRTEHGGTVYETSYTADGHTQTAMYPVWKPLVRYAEPTPLPVPFDPIAEVHRILEASLIPSAAPPVPFKRLRRLAQGVAAYAQREPLFTRMTPTGWAHVTAASLPEPCDEAALAKLIAYYLPPLTSPEGCLRLLCRREETRTGLVAYVW
jgi:hypothetical protein